VYAFALAFLNVPSLDAVYRMTWREFCLRSYGYEQKEKGEWYKVREIAYNSFISASVGLKKIPTKEQFMPLSGKLVKVGATESAKAKYLELYKKWQNERR
jgi:hypothetical protein